jgi:hypothetical protein
MVGISQLYHYTWLVVEMGSYELFAWAALGTMILPISASQVVVPSLQSSFYIYVLIFVLFFSV